MRKIVVLLCCFTYTILTAQTNLPSAQRIIDSACKEAAKQNKKALIIFMLRGVAGAIKWIAV